MPDPIVPIEGAPPEPKPGDKVPDLAKAIEGLLAKHGDASGALRVLLSENYELRDRNRDLKAKLPPDGAVVLAGDDAKDWAGYRQFGKPSDLKKALSERDQFSAEVTGFRKAEVVRAAAEITKFKPSVLLTLAEKLDLEVKDGKGKDGKPAKVAVVKGEGDSETPLNEYADAHWQDFLPALKGDGSESARGHGTPVGPQGRPMPAIKPVDPNNARPVIPFARI